MAGERQGANSQQDVSTISRRRLGLSVASRWGGKYAVSRS